LDALKRAFDESGTFSSNVDSSKSVEDRFGKVEALSREFQC
jgi:hypothetical protein